MDRSPDNKEAASLISIQGLKTQFGSQIIHDGLDLDVREGEILGVVGGSGTGKSVLLRTIIGLNQQQEGAIHVFGRDMTALTAKEAQEAQSNMGVLFQDGALFSALSVAQNIKAPMQEHMSLSVDLMNELAALKISMVGLPPEAGAKLPSELSGGMRKRAGLARALALDPKLVFLDEPTAGLDPIGAAAFDQLILNLRDRMGLSVFMVTHDLDSLFTICDRVAVLAEKKVIAVAPVEELLEHQHPWIQEYFHGPRARALQHGGE